MSLFFILCGLWSPCLFSLYSATVLTDISLNTGMNKKERRRDGGGGIKKKNLPCFVDWLCTGLPLSTFRPFTTLPCPSLSAWTNSRDQSVENLVSDFSHESCLRHVHGFLNPLYMGNVQISQIFFTGFRYLMKTLYCFNCNLLP